MPNPGSFHGARKAFLISQKAEYAAAVKDHNAAEALSHILRRFFKRFPIDLPDDFEPSETQLAAVDDNAPDPVLSDHGTTTESDSDLEIQSAGPSARNGKKKKKNKKAKKTSKSRKKRIEFRRAVRNALTSSWLMGFLFLTTLSLSKLNGGCRTSTQRTTPPKKRKMGRSTHTRYFSQDSLEISNPIHHAENPPSTSGGKPNVPKSTTSYRSRSKGQKQPETQSSLLILLLDVKLLPAHCTTSSLLMKRSLGKQRPTKHTNWP